MKMKGHGTIRTRMITITMMFLLASVEVFRLQREYFDFYQSARVAVDALMYFQRKDMFVLPFLMILPFYLESRRDFFPDRVARYPGRQQLWISQTKKNILYSGLLTLWIGVCCIAVFWLRGCQWCNWGTEEGSLFLQFGITADRVSFPIVLGVYLLILWLKFMIVSLFMLLIFWIQGHFIYSVVGALVLTEYVRFDRTNVLYIHLDFWKDFPKSLIRMIVPLAVLSAMFGAGYYLAKRKEFYGKKTG